MNRQTDVFVEQIVKKKFGPADYAIAILAVVAGLALAAVSFFVPGVGVLILVLDAVGVYYLITSRNLEFEYSVTNGDITVDRIINRRRRKRVINTDAQYIEDIGRYDPKRLANKQGYAKIVASQYDDGRGSWYFCARDPKKGNILVVFDPEEKVLGAIKPFLPRQVAFSAFGRN